MLAEDAMANDVVSEVDELTCTVPTEMPAEPPDPLNCTVVAPLTKLVPVSVTLTVVPGAPDVGEIDVKVGGPLAVLALTVNVTPLLIPALVVTVTVRAPAVADDEIVNDVVS